MHGPCIQRAGQLPAQSHVPSFLRAVKWEAYAVPITKCTTTNATPVICKLAVLADVMASKESDAKGIHCVRIVHMQQERDLEDGRPTLEKVAAVQRIESEDAIRPGRSTPEPCRNACRVGCSTTKCLSLPPSTFRLTSFFFNVQKFVLEAWHPIRVLTSPCRMGVGYLVGSVGPGGPAPGERGCEEGEGGLG